MIRLQNFWKSCNIFSYFYRDLEIWTLLIIIDNDLCVGVSTCTVRIGASAIRVSRVPFARKTSTSVCSSPARIRVAASTISALSNVFVALSTGVTSAKKPVAPEPARTKAFAPKSQPKRAERIGNASVPRISLAISANSSLLVSTPPVARVQSATPTQTLSYSKSSQRGMKSESDFCLIGNFPMFQQFRSFRSDFQIRYEIGLNFCSVINKKV